MSIPDFTCISQRRRFFEAETKTHDCECDIYRDEELWFTQNNPTDDEWNGGQ